MRVFWTIAVVFLWEYGIQHSSYGCEQEEKNAILDRIFREEGEDAWKLLGDLDERVREEIGEGSDLQEIFQNWALCNWEPLLEPMLKKWLEKRKNREEFCEAKSASNEEIFLYMNWVAGKQADEALQSAEKTRALKILKLLPIKERVCFKKDFCTAGGDVAKGGKAKDKVKDKAKNEEEAKLEALKAAVAKDLAVVRRTLRKRQEAWKKMTMEAISKLERRIYRIIKKHGCYKDQDTIADAIVDVDEVCLLATRLRKSLRKRMTRLREKAQKRKEQKKQNDKWKRWQEKYPLMFPTKA